LDKHKGVLLMDLGQGEELGGAPRAANMNGSNVFTGAAACPHNIREDEKTNSCGRAIGRTHQSHKRSYIIRSKFSDQSTKDIQCSCGEQFYSPYCIKVVQVIHPLSNKYSKKIKLV